MKRLWIEMRRPVQDGMRLIDLVFTLVVMVAVLVVQTRWHSEWAIVVMFVGVFVVIYLSRRFISSSGDDE